MEKAAEVAGWLRIHDLMSGWTCPFHAPKTATKGIIEMSGGDYTPCARGGCCNANVSTNTGILLKDGWRNVEGEWFCPACWKTTQSEPEPIVSAMGKESVEENFRHEIRKLAKEEIEAAFQRLLAKCTKGREPQSVKPWISDLFESEANIPF